VSSVLVREDMHPMIKRALMQTMILQHAQAGPLHRTNEFPHLKRLEFPGSAQSRDVLREGLPWLERHLSLQWAQWVYRLIWIGLPLALIACLLCASIPEYLVWRMDSRINRWYGELKFIENDLVQGAPGGLELAQFRGRLKHISQQVSDSPMPYHYMQRMFILQQHIALVGKQMQARLGR
jgi:uncharacterized protein